MSAPAQAPATNNSVVSFTSAHCHIWCDNHTELYSDKTLREWIATLEFKHPKDATRSVSVSVLDEELSIDPGLLGTCFMLVDRLL
jgi:hypothetical protein